MEKPSDYVEELDVERGIIIKDKGWEVLKWNYLVRIGENC